MPLCVYKEAATAALHYYEELVMERKLLSTIELSESTTKLLLAVMRQDYRARLESIEAMDDGLIRLAACELNEAVEAITNAGYRACAHHWGRPLYPDHATLSTWLSDAARCIGENAYRSCHQYDRELVELVERATKDSCTRHFPLYRQLIAVGRDYKAWRERDAFYSQVVKGRGLRDRQLYNPHRIEKRYEAVVARLSQNYLYCGYSSFESACRSEGLVPDEWYDHIAYEEEWDLDEIVLVEDQQHCPDDLLLRIPRDSRILFDKDGEYRILDYGLCNGYRVGVVHEEDSFMCEDCQESFHVDDMAAYVGDARCNNCEESYTSCDSCDIRMHTDESYYSEVSGNYLCETCYCGEESGSTFHFYNSSMPGSDNVDSWVEELYAEFPGIKGTIPSLRIGPEIEVSSMDENPEDYDRTISAGWEGKEDGTNGVIAEYVPHHRLIGERGLARLMQFHELLGWCGAFADYSCGGHIHLDLSGCENQEQRDAVWLRFNKRWCLFEEMFYGHVFESRGSFAKRLYYNSEARGCYKNDTVPDQFGRYYSVVSTGRTIEVRAAHSMLGKSAVAWAYLMMRMLCDTDEAFPVDDAGMVAADMEWWMLNEIPECIRKELGIDDDLVGDTAEEMEMVMA